jgi:signal transduction histidine kinase
MRPPSSRPFAARVTACVRLRSLYRTSSFRLALLFAGVTGMSFALLFAVIFWSTTRFMRHQIDDSVANELNEIMTEAPGDVAATRAMVSGLARQSAGFTYLFQDAQGNVLAGNIRALPPRVGVYEWESRATHSDRHRGRIRGQGVQLGENYLFVGWSTHQLHEMEEFIAISFIWGSAAAIALALAGGAVMSARLSRKIDSISATSHNIIQGDLSQRVAVEHAGDEFDRLSLSINAMLDRIETLLGDLRQVTTDIAHDLRTPLTRMGQRLERAARSDAGEPVLRDTLGAARRELDDILAMFAALLRIAEVESGARKAAFSQVDVREIADTAVEIYRSSAEEKAQQIEHRVDADLTVLGDRGLLIQLFGNLLENAIRHCPAGARIQVLAQRRGPVVEVAVADNGPGIPAPMRSKVLQRFFRLENSRTTPGYGLGLSLAAAIANLHDAPLSISDNSPGLRVSLRLAGLGNVHE